MKAKLLQYNADGRMDDSEFIRMTADCDKEIKDIEKKINALNKTSKTEREMKKELAEIKTILKAAEKHIDGEEIDRAFVDRYISDITIYPDEEITRFEIHLKAGTTVTKTLQNLTSRAGSNSNVTLTVYDENDLFDMCVAYSVENITDTHCSGVLNLDIDCIPQAINVEIVDFKTNETVISTSAYVDGAVSVPFENLKLWDTEHPNLYIVKIKSENDEVSKRIGLRTIEVNGAKVLLNGKETYMKGCEWMPGSHPDYGMAEPLSHSIKCLSQLKNAGCVFTRFHWQQDTSLFDWCDENGLLVQEEIPYWGHPKKATTVQLKIAKQHADEMIHYHSHHPSIICWGVGNELGGREKSTIKYVDEMYKYFKSLDNTRLVNYVSCTLHFKKLFAKDDAALHGDIAMWNEYLGLWMKCKNIKQTIIESYNRCGNMPSMVTEFVLCEPAFKGGDERRTHILLERIPIYKSLPNMVGYVWFSLNDYRTHCGEAGEGKLKQRIHGSTDLYGNEKPSYKVFSQV